MPEYSLTNPLTELLVMGFSQAAVMLAAFAIGFFATLGSLAGMTVFWIWVRRRRSRIPVLRNSIGE